MESLLMQIKELERRTVESGVLLALADDTDRKDTDEETNEEVAKCELSDDELTGSVLTDCTALWTLLLLGWDNSLPAHWTLVFILGTQRSHTKHRAFNQCRGRLRHSLEQNTAGVGKQNT